MLTDYERYQLEWMIEHGHSLKEFVQGLDSIFDSLSDKYDPDIMDSIDNLPDAYEIWERDYGFDGEIFSNEREFASLENDVITKDMIRAGIEHGVIRFEANPDPNDPWKTVCAIGNGWFYHVDTTDIPPDEYIRMNSRNVDMVVDEIYDELNSTVKSDYHDDFKRYLAVLSEEHPGGTNSLTGVPADIKELMEDGGVLYNPETGDLIVSYLTADDEPIVEVLSAKTYELSKFVTQLTPRDIEVGISTHEYAGRFAHHVATYQTLDELVSAGHLDNKNLLDVSSAEQLFKTGLAIGTAEGSDIDLLVKRDIEEGRTVYAHDRGIAIASYLDDAENPRIEVSHYTPYELASLVNARMAPDASDIRDVLTDPSRPRAFDHEVATFDSIDDFLARMGSPTSISQKWLPMCGDRLEPSIAILGIKQTDNVREWYTLAFPGDELAVGINSSLTFDDTIAAVPTGDGFYTALGDAADSLLRERIFEELCNRYGYTYDEVYDSWLHESPLPSPAISQHPEKIAVAAGYRFNLVDSREASGIDLKDCGTVVTVDGHDYNVMKGATYEDSRKVDDLLDSHGDKPISDYRKRPQGMSLKQAARESREASAKLSEKNGGNDAPDGKTER